MTLNGGFGNFANITGSGTYNGPVQITFGRVTGSQIFNDTFTSLDGRTISGSQTFSGTTTIIGQVSGSQRFNQPTTISRDTLSGTQVFADTLTVGASGSIQNFTGSFSGLVTFAAGSKLAGPRSGIMTFPNGLSLAATSTLDFQLGATADQLVVSGGLLSGPACGKVTINLIQATGYTARVYTLIDSTTAAGTSSFDASDFQVGRVLAGTTAANNSFAISGDTLQLTAITLGNSVPEPSTWAALVGAPVLGFAMVRRRMIKPRANAP